MSGMKVIVGLGNPGEQYVRTRHNAGFMVLDKLADDLGIALENSPKMFAKVGKDEQYILVQPQTFMNDSGRAVWAVLSFFKLTLADLIVVHDDLDIAFGQYKIQQGVGPKAHNGLLSIYEALGSEDFLHVRIGVEGRTGDRSLPGKAYVLQEFSSEEQAEFPNVIRQVIQELLP